MNTSYWLFIQQLLDFDMFQSKLPPQLEEILVNLTQNCSYRAIFTKNNKFKPEYRPAWSLTPSLVAEQYQHLLKGKTLKPTFKEKQSHQLQDYWCPNEFSLFVWIYYAATYLIKNYKQFPNLQFLKENTQVTEIILSILYWKNPYLISFEIDFIKKANKIQTAWSNVQVQLLKSILKAKKPKINKEWIDCCRNLFIASKGQFFRTFLEIRKKWIIELCPRINHHEWSNSQSLIVLQTVSKFGKKWPLIARYLKHTRSQPSIKEHFKRLIHEERVNYKWEPKTTYLQLTLSAMKRLEAQVEVDNLQEQKLRCTQSCMEFKNEKNTHHQKIVSHETYTSVDDILSQFSVRQYRSEESLMQPEMVFINEDDMQYQGGVCTSTMQQFEDINNFFSFNN